MLRALNNNEMEMVSGGSINGWNDPGNLSSTAVGTGTLDSGGEYGVTGVLVSGSVLGNGNGSYSQLFGQQGGGMRGLPGSTIRDRDGNVISPDSYDSMGRPIFDPNDNPTSDYVPGVPDQLEGGTITDTNGVVYHIPDVLLCC